MNGPTLKTIREFVGLTVADVAEHCGVDARTAHRWEEPGSPWPPPTEAVAYVSAALAWLWQSAASLEELQGVVGEWPEIFGESAETLTLKRYPSEEAYLAGAGNEIEWSLNVYTRMQGFALVTQQIKGKKAVINWTQPDDE